MSGGPAKTGAATVFVARDLILDVPLDAAAEGLRALGHTVVRGPAQLPGQKIVFTPAQAAETFADVDVMVVTTRVVVDDALLDAASSLRGIVFPSIGIESVDMAGASARGLIVANGATRENFESMAEATVMLMLALLYDLRATERVLRDRLPRPTRMTARMLKGKTVGLIGLGRIATAVVERLAGWGVEIVAHLPRASTTTPPAGVRLVSLDALLALSDIVSLHVPATPQTANLIDAAALRKMKPGAFLINTARGACVDEAAVAEALAEGRIAGAALDAFAVEPLPAASPLRAADHALLTPHMVGHTVELIDSFGPACVANVAAVLAGALPPGVCNPGAAEAWRHRLDRLRPR